MHDIKEEAIYLAQNIIEEMNNASELNDLWQFHVEDSSQLGADASEVINPLSPLVRYWGRFMAFSKTLLGKETAVVPS